LVVSLDGLKCDPFDPLQRYRLSPSTRSQGFGRTALSLDKIQNERQLRMVHPFRIDATMPAAWRATVDEDGHDCFARAP
jgi:hypothetical protein